MQCCKQHYTNLFPPCFVNFHIARPAWCDVGIALTSYYGLIDWLINIVIIVTTATNAEISAVLETEAAWGIVQSTCS